MDLSLLRHLSERALREEAARRGLRAEGDRAALIAAIEAHAAQAPATAPSSPAPAAHEEGPEPIRTRTMADLLSSQGHHERAERIYRELWQTTPGDAELRARFDEAHALASGLRLDRASQLYLRELTRSGLRVLSEGPLHAIVWRVDEAGRARAEALVGAGSIVLRLVRVSVMAHRGVDTRTEDQPASAQGLMRIGLGPRTHLIASVGMRGPRGFASIANARTST